MKAGAYLETIFAQAAALHQSGRFRNTVYCIGRKVYVLNQDRTVLLRFDLHRSDPNFSESVCFSASDYDSAEFQCSGDRIEFVQRAVKGFVRIRSCKSPAYTPEQIEAVFDGFEEGQEIKIVLPATIRSLLDEHLSHIEFKVRKGRLRILQRDIYAGTLIRITKDDSGFDFESGDMPNFGPVGLRTDDFLALYSLASTIEFGFGQENVVSLRSLDPKWSMCGWLSQCIYDELGGDFDGREKQKERSDKSALNRPTRSRASFD